MSVVQEDVPNFKLVTPREKSKLSPLMKHYGKMAHPFTACVRDNRKRFGDRAEAVCAVLKDLIRGTTKWRNQEEALGALLEAAGGDVAALEEMYRDDLARRLDIVIEHVGWEAVALAIYDGRVVESKLSAKARKGLPKGSFVFPGERRYPIHDLAHARNALARCSGKPEEGKVKAAVFARYPQLKKDSALREEIVRLAGLYAAASGERTSLDVVIEYAEGLAEGAQAQDEARRRQQERTDRARDRARGLTPPSPKLTGSKHDESKHPRGRKGTTTGGKFVRAGSGGPETRAVQRAVGAKEDGSFGNQTQAAVMDFQKRHGLVVDGVVGKQTASAMLGNRSASKLNTGAMTESQNARLRDSGRSRKRRSQVLREEHDAEILVEFALRSLARGARDYVRIGGGHGGESGRFSKRPVAAIGSPGGLGTARTFREKTTRRQISPEERQRQASKALGRKLGPSERKRAIEREAPKPHAVTGAKSQFAPGGTGERLGVSITDAEHKVVEAVLASDAYKAARAEMIKLRTVEQLAPLKPGELNATNTQSIYGGEEGKPGKVYRTPARQKLHQEIIRAFSQGTAQERPAPTGPIGGRGNRHVPGTLISKPDVLFMAGGGASGKSTILNSGQMNEPDRACLINADAIKACLPEFDAMRAMDDDVAKKAAHAVHEESSDVTKRLTQYAQMAGANYVVDGTGDSARGKFLKSLNAARDKGADVRVSYATTYIEDAADRAAARFETSRRYVAPDIVYSAHRGAADNFNDVAASDFPVEIYDTTHLPPTLVAKREKGKGEDAIEVFDQAAWDRFRARASYQPGKSTPDRMPTELLSGRDLIMALDSGRVKLSALTPGQVAEVKAARKKKRQEYPGAAVAKAVTAAAEFRSKARA